MNGTVGFIGYFSHRKFLATFASPNRCFTQSSRWVPLALFIGFVCSGVIVCLFVCLFVFCRCLSSVSVSCWRGCLRFAKRCSLCSAVCCCLLQSVAGKSSPARISSQLVNPALLCLLWLLLIARYSQTVTIVSQTMNKHVNSQSWIKDDSAGHRSQTLF